MRNTTLPLFLASFLAATAAAAGAGPTWHPRPAPSAELREACVKLAEHPRVELLTTGSSHEDRELQLLVISSEENLAKLDATLATRARLADPRSTFAPGELARLLETTPAVVLYEASIHGDELSGADASILLAAKLAVLEGERERRIREQLVVLVDPNQNPDGRERVLATTAPYIGRVPNPDPETLSHTGVWPWGRTNHYWFDLNRDWFSLTQPESRARAATLAKYMPQLVVDSHEMGSDSTFLFNPPRAPFNPLLPSGTMKWWTTFAKDHASAFDAQGWSYFTREWNEEWFIGYGSSLPLYLGSIGLLHEQASNQGLPIRQPGDQILDYDEAVAHQLEGALANIDTAARNRRGLLEHWRSARAEALARGAGGPVRAWYISTAPDPGRARRLASTFVQLGIEVETTSRPAKLTGVMVPRSAAARDIELPSGSYRVRTEQAAGNLVSAILQPHLPMTDSYLAQEREHLERQKGSKLYDITAWSPLLLSGLDSAWGTKLDSGPWTRVTMSELAFLPQKQDLDAERAYGLLFAPGRDSAVALAAKLAEEGLVVRVAEEPFTNGGRSFPRGSFLLRREENPKADWTRVAARAAELDVELIRAASALSEKGADLGGDLWTPLAPPRIALLAAYPVGLNSAGWAWFLLDHELGLRTSLLDAAQVASIDLRRYNVIVIPDCYGSDTLARTLGEGGLDALREWTSDGGTLVALAGGAELAATESSKLSSVRLRAAVLKDHPAPSLGLDRQAVLALERPRGQGLGEDGKVVSFAGAWSETSWPKELGIPGAGSPMVGPTAKLFAAATATRPAAGKAAKAKPAETKDEAKNDELDDKEKERAAARLRRFLPTGALLGIELDEEHWLAGGVGAQATALIGQSDAFIAKEGARAIGRHGVAPDMHQGGLLWPEGAGYLARTAWLTRESKGRGQIILFASDPNFRAWCPATQRLFLNAVILGPGCGTSRTIPW